METRSTTATEPEQPLTPKARAAVLRYLAATPGLTVTGMKRPWFSAASPDRPRWAGNGCSRCGYAPR